MLVNHHEHLITTPRRRNSPFFILNLSLDVVDRVRRLDLQCDCLARQGLDEDLHPISETEYKMERRLLPDVVIR